MQQGHYEEKLQTGGTLKVSADNWYIEYYFPGPDLRYNGTFRQINGKEIDSYIVSLKDNFKKYLDMKNNFDGKSKLSIAADNGMSIQLGGTYGSGVYMFYYHKLISTQEDLHNVIRDLIYAKKKAISIQSVFAGGDLKTIPQMDFSEEQDPDLDGYYETLIRIKNEFNKFYPYFKMSKPPFDAFYNSIQDLLKQLKQQVTREKNSLVWDCVLKDLFKILVTAKNELSIDSVKNLLSFIDFSCISQELINEVATQLFDILNERNSNNSHHITYAYLIYQILKYGTKSTTDRLILNLKNISPNSNIAILRYTEVMNSCKRYNLPLLSISIPEIDIIPMPEKPQKPTNYYLGGVLCIFVVFLCIWWFAIRLQEDESIGFQLMGILFFSFGAIGAFLEAPKKYQRDCTNYDLATRNFKDYQLQVYTNRKFAELQASRQQNKRF